MAYSKSDALGARGEAISMQLAGTIQKRSLQACVFEHLPSPGLRVLFLAVPTCCLLLTS